MWPWRPLGPAVIGIESNLAGCLGAAQHGEDGGAWTTAEHACFCVLAAAWCCPRQWCRQEVMACGNAAQLLNTLCAMSSLTNLSCQTGSVIPQNIQKAFLWLPRGKELNGLQPRVAFSLGGKRNRRRMCGWRAEGQKGEQRHMGSPQEQGSTESYRPILKRDYFNLHNKKCRYRLNSTQSTYESIGCLCSPGAPFLCLSELDPEGHRLNYSWL